MLSPFIKGPTEADSPNQHWWFPLVFAERKSEMGDLESTR